MTKQVSSSAQGDELFREIGCLWKWTRSQWELDEPGPAPHRPRSASQRVKGPKALRVVLPGRVSVWEKQQVSLLLWAAVRRPACSGWCLRWNSAKWCSIVKTQQHIYETPTSIHLILGVAPSCLSWLMDSSGAMMCLTLQRLNPGNWTLLIHLIIICICMKPFSITGEVQQHLHIKASFSRSWKAQFSLWKQYVRGKYPSDVTSVIAAQTLKHVLQTGDSEFESNLYWQKSPIELHYVKFRMHHF